MTNVTALNSTLMDAGNQFYLPWPIWVMLIVLFFIFLFLSFYVETANDITAIIAVILAPLVGWLSGFVAYTGTDTQVIGGTVYVIPWSYVFHFSYLGYFFGMLLFFVGIVNIYRVWMTRKKHGTFEDGGRMENPYFDPYRR